MLVLFVQGNTQNKVAKHDLQKLVMSKIPDVSFQVISRQESFDIILDMSQPVLFITNDIQIDSYLDKKGFHVLLWQGLPELSVKLDMFLQLQRYTSDFPLILRGWSLREVLHNCDDSIIYRAINENGQQVAIKRFKFLPSSLTEQMINDLLNHLERKTGTHAKGLVKFYEGGISNNAFYLVMEYLKYGTLRQALNGCGNVLPLTHALEWFQEIVIALDSVHKAGLIHRDLKIDNILMREDGSLALMDYGVSKRLLLDAGLMQEQELHCSPHYVSPEQISGDACTKASDIYSLGVIFYELLTGKKPYSANMAHELMMHHVMAPVPRLPKEYQEFQDMIDKMMAKNPDDRFLSALDALESLPIAA